MENIIIIENITFKYRNKDIFNNFNLAIKKGLLTTIMGPNGSGKSTLVKIIVGLLYFNGIVKIDDEVLTKGNIKEIRKKIGVVMSNPDNQFVAETVMDDIAFTLENMNYKRDIIKQKIEEVTRYLGIYDILQYNPHDLSGGQKQLVALASALVHDPEILILDEALSMIEPLEKDRIFKLLLDLKEKGLTIINVTHDIEESIFSDEIVVIDNGKIILKGTKEQVYEQDRILKKMGFELPFMVELSNRLKFYDLIDETIYDMETMVDILWK